MRCDVKCQRIWVRDGKATAACGGTVEQVKTASGKLLGGRCVRCGRHYSAQQMLSEEEQR